jgi:hypothetical protein
MKLPRPRPRWPGYRVSARWERKETERREDDGCGFGIFSLKHGVVMASMTWAYIFSKAQEAESVGSYTFRWWFLSSLFLVVSGFPGFRYRQLESRVVLHEMAKELGW